MIGAVLSTVIPEYLSFVWKSNAARSAAKRAAQLLAKKVVRPGIGSKVTTGALKLGKQTLIGPARPGVGTIVKIGAKVAAGAGAAAVLTRGVATHKVFTAAPKTQPKRQPARAPVPRPVSTGTKKCCPEGTRRMVCFKRKKSVKREIKELTAAPKKTRKFSAKQLANQRRFAAAARARRKR